MRKVVIITLCALYVLSPIDVIVDVLPIIGWLDDLAAIAATICMLASSDASVGGPGLSVRDQGNGSRQ